MKSARHTPEPAQWGAGRILARAALWVTAGLVLPALLTWLAVETSPGFAPGSAATDGTPSGESPQSLPPSSQEPPEPSEQPANPKELLESYGWVDREAGVAHVPIRVAMQRVLARGLPARPDSPKEER